jgi:hypothetical protein
LRIVVRAVPLALVVALAGCYDDAPERTAVALDLVAGTVADAEHAHASRVLAAVAPFVDIDTWPLPLAAPVAQRVAESAPGVPDASDPRNASDAGDAPAPPSVVALFGLSLRSALDDTRHPLLDLLTALLGDVDLTATPSITDDAWAAASFALLRAPADEPPLANLTAALLAARALDGGWAWDAGPVGGVDETAWAVRALVLTGHADAIRGGALAFFAAAQTQTGLYAAPGVGANCQSTGLAVQGLRWLDAAVPASAWDALDSCWTGTGWAHTPGGHADVWATLDILTAYWPDAVFGLAPA